jgi:hypothetical protein
VDEIPQSFPASLFREKGRQDKKTLKIKKQEKSPGNGTSLASLSATIEIEAELSVFRFESKKERR